MAAGKMARATVAPGRTVVIPRDSGARDEKGVLIKSPTHTRHGPGELVTLPEEEIATLRARGFLVDPKAPPVSPTAEGPTFTPEAGPAVVSQG
jgi:hypothetical protein